MVSAMKVLVVKNTTREAPGLLGNLLDAHGIRFDLVDLSKAERFPDPLRYKAMVILGGTDSANDRTGRMGNALAQIRRATVASIPYLGICLGMQMLVRANGGKVVKSGIKEIGWKDSEGRFFEMVLTAEGVADPLFKGLRSRLPVFQLHGELAVPTPSMALLATGEPCMNQAVRVGRIAYGLQGHFELTAELLGAWSVQDGDLMALRSGELERDYRKVRDKYERAGNAIMSNFLRLAGLL